MKPSGFLLLLLALAPGSVVAEGQTWHVAGSGNDSWEGTTLPRAFRTLQRAAGVVEPGDTVMIGDGEYATPAETPASSVVVIDRSGRPDAWITWRARDGANPVIRPTGWNGILVTGSYHRFEGLTIEGANDSITLAEALADAKNAKPNGRFNTNGIFINGRLRPPEQKPHHVLIRNCTVAKCPGGGIVAIESDYLTVEDCRVFENGWFMRYGGSGITTLHNWRFDDAPGYHVVIQRNRVWNNKTLVPWEKVGRLSDGNGILLDVTEEDAEGASNPNADTAIAASPSSGEGPAVPKTAPSQKLPRPAWKGRALVANNVCAFNGGSGIHTFRTRHVDIVNNTTYWNGQIVGYPELFANRSDDVVILNNIIVPRPAGKVTSNNRNGVIRWDYNLYPVSQTVFDAPNDLVADPGFVSEDLDRRVPRFRTRPDGPATDSGSAELPQRTDITGAARPRGRSPDRGAYEQ